MITNKFIKGTPQKQPERMLPWKDQWRTNCHYSKLYRKVFNLTFGNILMQTAAEPFFQYSSNFTRFTHPGLIEG